MRQAFRTERIPFLGGEALIAAHSMETAYVTSIEGEGPFILNGLPIEFRIWLKKNHAGHWYANSIFAYRLDRQAEYHPNRPATDNQKRKLYRAAVEAAEALTGEQLLRAEVFKAQQELERAEDAQLEAQRKVVDALLEVEALKATLEDLAS